MVEIYNARITNVFLGCEDHDILTAFIYLEFEAGTQGFGGYNLQATGANYCARFIRGILDALDVRDWSKLKGQYCRILFHNGKGTGCGNTIDAIGHIVKDQWFDRKDMAI